MGEWEMEEERFDITSRRKWPVDRGKRHEDIGEKQTLNVATLSRRGEANKRWSGRPGCRL